MISRRRLPELIESTLSGNSVYCKQSHSYTGEIDEEMAYMDIQQTSGRSRNQAASSLCAAIETTRSQMQLVITIGVVFWFLCLTSASNISFVTIVAPISSAAAFTATVLLFAVQCILSVRYDSLVRRRHVVLMDMAEQSQSIVREIFPETVRDRLLQNRHYDDEVSLQHRQFCGKQRRRRSTGDLPFERSSQKNDETFSSNGQYGSNTLPIVDYYNLATVLFADIVGFTAFSAERDPFQVFTFLEHLYAAFDAASLKHNIFKVETIGDSYMAVAGLPDIDDEHVVQMARFANEMLLQMKRVTTDMDAYLGGTRDLNLRIGINSGPVTAGVLRGQKARFQLFGDTVNTAARMESHSIPGKVQISQSTADLLLKAGKVSWIQAREGLINAKGKGELKTYWLVADAIAGENRDTSPAKSAYSPLSSLPIEMKTVDLEEPSHHEEPVMIPLACKHSPTNSLSQPRYRALSRFNSSLSSPPPLDSLNVGSRYDVDV